MRLLVVAAVLVYGGQPLHIGSRVLGPLHLGLPRRLVRFLRTIRLHRAIRFRGPRNVALGLLWNASLRLLRDVALRFSAFRLWSFAEARLRSRFGTDVHRLTLLLEVPSRGTWIPCRDHTPVL